MSIEELVPKVRRSICRKKVVINIAIVMGMIFIMSYSFAHALEYTVPNSVPQVDETLLRMAIMDICDQPLSESADIVLKEISRGRDLSDNREYMEYNFEYTWDEICYTGQLTVCYEYHKKSWKLVSIGITKLKQEDVGILNV